ncbi:hypothetical protein [Microbulbifer magnicolonia]|uniref:hypothetical protein n=1 Tax=Microbulbifer magnicolonia TaxID=3109744 RepID=UPI002B40FDEC|nr:hypothetical protein [Microbulbifer sp. GG15]
MAMGSGIRRLIAFTALLAALLSAVLYAGGAVHWDREPPYQLVDSWGGRGSDPGQFNDPTGIAVGNGEVFVADARNRRIQVFDKRGNFRRAFGGEVLERPMNLAIADGRLYVPDYFRDVIQVFALDGSHLRTLGAGAGLDSPGGVAVRGDGSLLVADTYGQRVLHLDADGRLLHSWGGRGSGAGAFSYPTDVAAAGGGFYVADGYNDRIQQFDADGALVRKWGGPFAANIFGPFRGWFATATSVAAGADGSVFVADFYNDRIQKFSGDGRFLTAFGTPSRGPGHTQIAVAVDADGSVWSANYADNRVEKWRPLQQTED